MNIKRHLQVQPVLVILALLFAGCTRNAPPATPNAIFDAGIRSILTHSTVPVYLPAWIPAFSGPQKKLFVMATLYPLGYLVTVDPVKGCNGAGVCSFLAFTATTEPPDANGLAVPLRSGAIARFHAIACGASCGPATLEWRQGRYTYAIQMKGGDESTLVRIADSFVVVP